MSDVIKKQGKTFEDIRQKTKDGVEFWSARDLQTVLAYKSWDKFKVVIQKAIESCAKSGNLISDYFSQVGKIVKTGLGIKRHVQDYDYRFTQYTNVTHHEVGKKVRQTIKELGGTMPENLPTPKSSVKALEKRKRNITQQKEKMIETETSKK